MMTIEEFIERDEGRRLEVYYCPSGAKTIGVGHNIDALGLPPGVKGHLTVNGAITDEMADYLLKEDIKIAEGDAKAIYRNFGRMNKARQMALINFLFQLGYSKVQSFKWANAAIEREDWMEAARELLDSKWARQTPDRARRIATIIEGGKLI